MLVLKKELGLFEFEKEFRDELKGLPLDAIEIIFDSLCQHDLVNQTVTGIRDYLRFQMQVMSLKDVIHSYGYMMDLEDLEDDEIDEVVDDFLCNNTYVLGSFDEDDDIFYIFDEFLKSNSKEVRESIRLHLIEISENDDVEVETVEQAVKYIGDRFNIEALRYDKSSRSIQELFIYWISGLSLNTYYITDNIINYLHSIGLYGKDEEQEQEKAADLYHYLIFKEVKNYIYKIM